MGSWPSAGSLFIFIIIIKLNATISLLIAPPLSQGSRAASRKSAVAPARSLQLETRPSSHFDSTHTHTIELESQERWIRFNQLEKYEKMNCVFVFMMIMIIEIMIIMNMPLVVCERAAPDQPDYLE